MLYDDFLRCCEDFLKVSEKVNDGWSLKKYVDHVYLIKTSTQYVENEVISEGLVNCLEDNSAELELDSQRADTKPQNFWKWEYHILYSQSYEVPVLYFNVWDSSGHLLNLNKLWQTISINDKQFVLDNRWFTLTQQEHPYHHKPFFYFHPCKTYEFIECFSAKSKNLLITWLSTIGPIVGLSLSDIYGQECFLKKS